MVMALARSGGCLRHSWPSSCNGPTPALPLAITPALGAALLPPLVGGAIALGRLPAVPGMSGLLTGEAAIALQGMRGQETLGTALEQAKPQIPALGALPRLVGEGIIRWAHGSRRSQRSSLGGELLLGSEALFVITSLTAYQHQRREAKRRSGHGAAR